MDKEKDSKLEEFSEIYKDKKKKRKEYIKPMW